MWTKKFQMYKLSFEEAEEPEIKVPTFFGLWRKQGGSRKKFASLTMLKPLTVWITTNCGKFFFFFWKTVYFTLVREGRWNKHFFFFFGKLLKRQEYQTVTYLLRNLYVGQDTRVKITHETTDWLQIGKGVCQGCILSPCLLNLSAEYSWEM